MHKAKILHSIFQSNGTWIGLKIERVLSSSCGLAATGGDGIGWNEEWLLLDSGRAGSVGKLICEDSP